MNFKHTYLTVLRRGPDGILRAPFWLRERMRRMRELPPPSIEEVRAQFAASARTRREKLGSIVR